MDESSARPERIAAVSPKSDARKTPLKWRGGRLLLSTMLPFPATWGAVLHRRVHIMHVQAALLIAGFLFLNQEVLLALPTMWISHDRLEGFLVPCLSLFLVWRQRNALAALTPRPSLACGAALTLLAGILLVLGKVGAVYVLQEISLLLSLAGLVLLILGPSYAKALSLPIGLLGFMLTVFEDVVNPLHWPFQLTTARQAANILQLLGFPALLDRQYVILPHATFEVARVCSGVNYLISILALAVPLAYLTLRTWGGRLALILSAVAIGIVGNWARIVLIAFWSANGEGNLHGPFHVFQGMFVAWAGYAFLFLAVWLLPRGERRFTARGSGPDQARPGAHVATPVGCPTQSAACHATRNRAWALAMLIMATVGLYLGFHTEQPTPLTMDLASFPRQIDEWVGEEVRGFEALPFRVAGADAEILRTFRHRAGHALQLYVGYLSSQAPGKKIPNDTTAELHRGARRMVLDLGPGETFVVNERPSPTGTNPGRLLFWYDTNGRPVAGRYRIKLTTLRNALLSGRTHAAFVTVQLDGQGDGESEGVEEEVQAFLRTLVPVLRRYLP